MAVRKSLGDIRLGGPYLMKASTTFAAGDLIMLDSDGLALPAAASASNQGCVGVAAEAVTSAASGSSYVNAQEGIFLLDATTIAQTDVGNVVFAEGATTIDETQGANEPVAGILRQVVSASSAYVEVSPAANLAGRAFVLASA